MVGNRATLTLPGTLGAVQNIALGSFELTRRLQHHLDDVLHTLDGRRPALRLGGDDIDHPLRQFGDGRIGYTPKTGEAARHRILDPRDIERNHAPIPLDDRRWDDNIRVKNVG
jgi:hypothetical protein